LLSKQLAKKNVYLIGSLRDYTPENEAISGGVNSSLPIAYDHIRQATLFLCKEEIESRKLKGAVAEFGVYRGEFAAKINALFPNRMLYLFDTFEGFDNKDVEKEVAGNYSAFRNDFSNTDIKLVMNKMKYPEKCIVKKGFFPDTTACIENVAFCFVSIDTDLYAPILSGLEFFYPRLEHGGYIFVHDYNCRHYKGSHQAVLQFCKENDALFVPLPDSYGSAVICK
jgi:O-methyltransferase